MGVICAGLGWYGFAMKNGPVELYKSVKDERYIELKAARKLDDANIEEAPVAGKYQSVSLNESRDV